MHEQFNEATYMDKTSFPEFLALGLGKGQVVIVHVAALDKVFCRFTVHRDSIRILKYLP